MATTLRDVMTPFPKSLEATVDVREAARLMAFEGIGDVIVCTNGQVSGIVTDRDITVRVVAQDKDPAMTPLSEIASTELMLLSPDHTVEDAIMVMRDRALRRLVIVDGATPVGIVTIGDLALDRDPESVLADIS